MPVANVADRAPAFNIPGEIAFGNDLFEVRRVARRALEHARSGKGPYLVEFKTFRQRGHGEHDDMGYVPPDLRSFWERRDPIKLLREYLLGPGGCAAESIEAIDSDCTAQIDRASDEAQALPLPAADSVTERLFAAPGERGLRRFGGR
jgi:TPP-dependent pyruvate/acetoin dehydrogenase alpha subunit